MSDTTQALAPANSSVTEFLAEIGGVTRECEKTRPSRLSFRALERWRQDKNRQIAEITKRYAGNSQNALVPSGNGDISSIDTEALEEVNGHIIKASCAAQKDRENIVRIENFRVFKFSKDDYLAISFIIKDSRGVLKISPIYKINFKEISIFTDVPTDKPIWLMGKEGSCWTNAVEFHVHSEDEVKFLLE